MEQITIKEALELLKQRYPDCTVNAATLKRACRKGVLYGAKKHDSVWIVTQTNLIHWYETGYDVDKRRKQKKLIRIR